MLGIPVIDTFQITKTVVKLTIFGLFLAFFLVAIPSIAELLTDTANKAFGGNFSSLSSINLGAFAGLIGLDVFLTALWNSIYIGVVFFISWISTLIGARYLISIMGIVMKM